MSKKLSGNGRWESSRMMLPEHRTQFLERHDGGGGEGASDPSAPAAAATNPRVPTKEELELIRSSVLLPMILSIAEKNQQEIDRSSYTFKPLYLKAMLVFMDVVSQEMARVRRELKQRNIRVIEDEQADLVMYYRFVCRGYEERFGMIREVVRAEIAVWITQYMRAVFAGAAGAGK
jgi:hypothetical protein